MKYLQLVDYINSLIEDGTLQIGDQIPSLNQLQTQLRMSKETLLKGLNYLLEMGVIEAIYRKGYFVKKVSINHSYHVFLLLDKMNVMREQIYRSIFKSLKMWEILTFTFIIITIKFLRNSLKKTWAIIRIIL